MSSSAPILSSLEVTSPPCPTRIARLVLPAQSIGTAPHSRWRCERAADTVDSVAMCQLATEQTSDWLMTDTWEPMHKEYQPTAVVLDHFDYEINTVRKGIDAGNGTRKPVRIALLAGADLVHTMSTPGVWSEKDLDHILGKYGVRFYLLRDPCCGADGRLDFHRRAQRYGHRRGPRGPAAVEG